MSRFISHAGSSLEHFQRQLARRQTVDHGTPRYGAADSSLSAQFTPGDFPSNSPPSPRFASTVGYGATTNTRVSPIHTHHRRGSSSTTPLLETFDQLAAPFSKPSSRPHSTSKSYSISAEPHQPHHQASDGNEVVAAKLDTFEGVFIPTVLSIWGIILFLRFGFIIGYAGVFSTLVMFCVAYFINLFTTFSLSAISTNGTVHGGGPYYMISRSLGPEFGGSIGLVFYIGTVLSCSMNILGFIEPLFVNFGSESGELLKILPENYWWGIFYGAILLVICTIICLSGSKPYARVSLILAIFLLISTISIFFTFFFQKPFTDESKNIQYEGFKFSLLQDNLYSDFSKVKGGKGRESFQSVFGVLFPACNGILQGASMSGDLRNPSHSIPRGTLNAVYVSFISYIAIVILMGGSITRDSMKIDLNILQDVALVPFLVTLGALSAAIYAVLGNVISAAKILQAIARDGLISSLQPFAQGTPKNDDPTYAVLLTFLLSQLFVFIPSINTIATLVTMTYLLTFLTTNLACFILKIGSAPNFRPSFQYFKWWTAALGVISCFCAMVFVDGWIAFVAVGVMGLIFGYIHYTSPPKSWGDVSQNLIYHQVRKYLLRLDSRKEHVKFWRPQVLLLVNNPRTAYQTILFCNALKKGALYVLGHVIEGNFRDNLTELKRQQGAWLRFVDHVKIKAFVQITVADSMAQGARNLVLGSGLGGMRPNIVVLGWFDLDGYRAARGLSGPSLVPSEGDNAGTTPLHPAKSDSAKADHLGQLPTDFVRVEPPVPITDYVCVIEDVLSLNKAVAIGVGFRRLELDPSRPPPLGDQQKQYIDLWPIQMTVPVDVEGLEGSESGLVATSFDTYAMVLQMGTILHMVPYWKERYTLRVICFVEREEEVMVERRRVGQLLENLRVPAELVVLWLDKGDIGSYETIVRGRRGIDPRIERIIAEWEKKDRQLVAELERPSSPSRQPSVSDSEGNDTISELHMTRSTSTGGRSNSLRLRSSSPLLKKPGFRRKITGSLPTAAGMKINLPLPTSPDDISESSSEEEDEHTEPSGLPYPTETSNFSSSVSSLPVPVPHSNRPDRLPPNAYSNQFSEIPIVTSPTSAGSFTDNDPSPYSPLPPHVRSSSTATATSRISQDFNTLPSRAQHLILNDLMRRSSTENTAIILTTLPAPEHHSSDNEAASLAYLESLELLVDGLPPTLLIHAKSLTVTMAL